MEVLANILSFVKHCDKDNTFDIRTLYDQLEKL